MTLTSANKAVSENVITVYLENPILNRLIYTPVTITKTDITGAKKLQGALIEVYDADGTTIYREYTNENGEIPNIPVVPGTYTFKETYAPSGYALNTAIKTFTVTADGQVHGDTVIRDEVNQIMLKKTKQNGEALAGAVFGLFDSEGNKVQEATSAADGILKVTVPLPRSHAAISSKRSVCSIKQVQVSSMSSYTSSSSSTVRLPERPGTLVNVLRSAGSVMGGCSET